MNPTKQEAFADICAIFYKAAELCRCEDVPFELLMSEEEQILAVLDKLMVVVAGVDHSLLRRDAVLALEGIQEKG